MNKRTGKRLGASLVFLFFLLTLTVSAVFAWFNNPLETSIGATSYVHKSYFESGDGTSATQYQTYDAQGNPVIGEGLTSDVGCAFEIKYPVQLYYFAWLQNMGYFNTPDEETGVLSPVYFYISDDLDMSEFVLPPVGTAEYPFIGAFNGNGHTITNLHVTNDSSVTDKPSEGETGAQIVGFFGVVGSYNGSATPNNHVASVENFTLNGVNIETSAPLDNESLIGVAAGYVNGVMDSVAIANSTVTVGSGVSALGMPQSESGGGTDNLSDYALVGYCTQPYRMQLNVTKVTLAAPVETQNVIYKNTQNEGPGFGGSIKMDDLFTRLTNVRSNLARTPTTAYPTAQTVIRDENGAEVSRVTTATSTSFTGNNPTKAARYYASDASGMYYFYNNSSNTFLYMYQETLTATNISYTGEVKNGFKVSNGANYMTLSAANALASTADAASANGWVLENGRLYTYSNANGSTYYLNATNTLSLGTTASTTTWARGEDGTLSYTYNNHTWYLTYNNGWSVYPGKLTFRIRSNGNYLNRSGTTTVNGVTNPGDTAEWAYDETTGGVSVYYNNTTVYYLNSSAAGVVSLGTTRTTSWTKTDNALYFTDNAGVKWYLRYANGAWSCFPGETAYRVTDGSYYFGVNGTAFAAVNAANAADWVWDEDNGHLYTVVSGTVRYLNATNTLTLGTTASTVWTRDGAAHMSYTYNNGTWYLYRIGTEWRVYPYAVATVISQDGNYLNIASTTAVGFGTDADAATRWVFDNGAISTYYNNNTYYLNASGANVSVSTTQTTTWTKNNDGTLSYTYNGAPWYLVYSGGWKAYPSLDLVTIHDGTNYLAPNGTSTVTNSADEPVYWIADGSKLYTVSGTTNYYLRAQTTGLSLSTAANGTNFTYDAANKRYYCTLNGTTYYVIYNGNNWTVSTSYTKGTVISVTSGNTTYYLNTDGSTVSTGTDESAATGWTYNGTSGTVSTVVNGTTYYLRAQLETNNKRNSTNLAMTATAGNATTFTYANNHLTCSIRVGNTNTTYSLALDNNTLKMVNTNATYYTIESANTRDETYGNYLSAEDTTFENTTNEDEAILWTFSSTDQPTSGNYTTTSLSTLVNGETRYMNLSNSSLTLSTASQNLRYYRYDNNNYFLYYYNNSNRNRYFLRYNDGNWLSNNSGTQQLYYVEMIRRNQVTFSQATVRLVGVAYETEEDASAVSAETVFTAQSPSALTYTPQDTYTELTYTDVRSAELTLTAADVHALRNDGTSTDGSSYASAFPINVNTTSPYAANPDTNTGYIVAGGYSQASTSGRGDIRVSRYAMSNISVALNQNNYSDARLEVITGMDNGTYSGWYRVSDSFNANNNNINNNVSSVVANNRKINYSTLGLKRYEDARQSMSDTFSGSSYIYGLHFMDAAINKDNVVTLPKAYIEGEEYTNYPVPNDSIDFNVKRRGFITVFAGTYYGGNDSFFSLHRIFRDDDNNITDIKEISQIYKPLVGDDYIYKYADDTYSDGKSASDCGSIAFDMARMTNPGSAMVENAVYYFEIPVNGGEFALGSVPGKDGAYLFYLDIAANGGQAEDKDRVTISERFTEQNYDVTLPRGVQLIDANGAYDATKLYETVTVELADGYTGAYTLNRAGTVFDYTETANATLTYIGGELVAGSGGTTVNYYPNGYTVTYVENITDTGRATNLVDKLRIETVDTYNSSGQITGDRVVTLYAGIELTDDESQFVRIVEFRYVLSGHENMKTRIVRAASEGGFNVVFDSTLTLTGISITDERVHVNFGDNTSNYMKVFTSATLPTSSVTMDSYTVINMSDPANKPEEVYYPAVFGPDVAAYYSYVEGGDGVERATDPALTTSPIPKGTTSATQSLNYGVTLSSPTAITVYATQLLNSYSGTTYVENAAGTAAQSASYAVNPVAIDFNGTALEYNVPKRIDITAS